MPQVETEKLVLLPLRNPRTNRRTNKWWYAGAVDRIERGERIVDWKSTGDVGRFATSKATGYQPECYALALRRMGYTITEYEYRAIQKPGIKLSGADHKAAKARLDSEAHDLTNERAIAARLARYAVAAYEQRCFEWLTADSSKMVSLVMPINEESMKQAEYWLWAVRDRIIQVRKSKVALTNESGCSAFGSTCAFLPLCTAAKAGDDVQTMMAEKFHKSSAHRELDLPEGVDPQNVITYSSASKFSLCEQKYVWGTHFGLTANDEETPESLYLGSAMHKGLEMLGHFPKLAMEEINKWEQQNPTVGAEMVEKQGEVVAKAKAMVRAAATRWS